MSHVKIKYLDFELSVDEPDNYANLLEEIKDFDDENLMNAEVDDILITDSKGNEINNNVDYNKYIKQDPSNRIIFVSLKHEEEKVFNLCDYSKEIDDHFKKLKEEEEIKKKEEEEKKKNQKDKKENNQEPEVLEEEEINYDPAFDEFNLLANKKNVYFIKQFWEVFENKMIKKFEAKIDLINNIANKDMLKKMDDLKNQFENQDKFFQNEIKNIKVIIKNIEVEQEKKINNLKDEIGNLKNEMIKNIKNNFEIEFKNIKSNIETQNTNLNERLNKIEKDFESEKLNLEKKFKNIEDNNKLQTNKLLERYNQIQNNLDEKIAEMKKNSEDNFKKQNKEILNNRQLIEEHSPIKVELQNLTEKLNLKDIINDKAECELKITNFSKVPIKNYYLRYKSNKDDILCFKDIMIDIEKDTTIRKKINLIYTKKKEYYDDPYIQIILEKDNKIINELFATFKIEDTNNNIIK